MKKTITKKLQIATEQVRILTIKLAGVHGALPIERDMRPCSFDDSGCTSKPPSGNGCGD